MRQILLIFSVLHAINLSPTEELNSPKHVPPLNHKNLPLYQAFFAISHTVIYIELAETVALEEEYFHLLSKLSSNGISSWIIWRVIECNQCFSQ